MPRPSLPDDERRSRRVLVRLSPREHDELRRRAGIARLGVPEFLRRAALGRRFRLQAPRRLAAADRRDLTRLGISLSQIARAANAGFGIAPEARLDLDRAIELLTRVLETE